MNEVSFLDTNVLVYAFDSDPSPKQPVARRLIREALVGNGVVSTQVLGEFASVMIHKLKASPGAVASAVGALNSIGTVPSDAALIRRAIEAHRQYGLRFYDGLIVAAAERVHCVRIWSEDLNTGQKYFGVTVENPFL